MRLVARWASPGRTSTTGILTKRFITVKSGGWRVSADIKTADQQVYISGGKKVHQGAGKSDDANCHSGRLPAGCAFRG
jgi:hypothetical protein